MPHRHVFACCYVHSIIKCIAGRVNFVACVFPRDCKKDRVTHIIITLQPATGRSVGRYIPSLRLALPRWCRTLLRVALHPNIMSRTLISKTAELSYRQTWHTYRSYAPNMDQSADCPLISWFFSWCSFKYFSKNTYLIGGICIILLLYYIF